MQKTCPHCRQSFFISDEDLKFYEKVSPIIAGKQYLVPPPTLCPECRQQRRFSWRNERHLYHRKSDLSGKQIISNLHPGAAVPIYEIQEWWSDEWNALNYGRDFDFSRPFFEQFAELQKVVPQLNLCIWYCENSGYCNYVGNVKNSYLIYGSVYSEDCYYGSPYYSKNCLDTLVVRECEWCYECVDCRKLYECFYCQDCHSSSGLIFCFDLQGCTDCIGCAGLRNKKYYIFNQPYTAREYAQKKNELKLWNPIVRQELAAKLDTLKKEIPHRYMQSNQVENVSGNYVYQSKNVLDSYYADRSEDCRFVAQVVDLKNCYDNNYTEENEFCYEYLGAYQVRNVLFSKFCNRVENCLYCDSCFHGHDLFGCISVRNKNYCILNKQYSKEEYEKLLPKIIEHMMKTPLTSPLRGGKEEGQEWGEFFPASHSFFSYNESVAQEYFPLSSEQVTAEGWQWYEEENAKNYLGPKLELPDDIELVTENICEQILLCEVTGKPYKIIPQELQFYKKFQLPLPRKCPDERHKERIALRNPRQLWQRACSQCKKQIHTSYAPDRPEKVYCEECYLAAVY